MKKIIVLGDLNMEVILSGINSFPEFGTEIFADDGCLKPGGSAANVALVLADCGTDVALFSAIGDDTYADTF